MKITDLRVNGIREPMGFSLPRITVSWKVTDTASKRPVRGKLTAAADPEFTNVMYEKEAECLCSAGEPVPVSLQPRTRYFVRIEVTGDGGDTAEGTTWFETGKWRSPGKRSGSARRRRILFIPCFFGIFPRTRRSFPPGCM